MEEESVVSSSADETDPTNVLPAKDALSGRFIRQAPLVLTNLQGLEALSNPES